MTRDEFLAELKYSRSAWEGTVNTIPPEKMVQPCLAGGWSGKDIIAHISWYENQMVEMIRAREITGSEWWGLPLDDRNQKVYEINQEKSLDEIFAESRVVFQELIAAIETLSDQDLKDPACWKNWPPEWKAPWDPGKVIASNCFDHYMDHLPDLESLKTP
jgi:hypothetical protein